MNYQGDNPNAPRERQPSGTGSQQPQTRQSYQQSQQPTQQQPQWQQQWQQPQGQTRQTQPQQPRQFQQPQQQGQTGTVQQTPTTTRSTGMQQTQPSQQAGGIAPGTMPQTQGMQQPRQTRGMQQQRQQQVGMGRAQFRPAKVEELIVTDVVTAQRDTPIRTVVSSMAENNVGSVVVVDDDGKTPIGLLTDRKVALALEGHPNIGEQTVEKLLSGDVITGTTEMTVFDALEQVSQAKIRRLPIVDEEGILQGIVTLDDLLVFMGNQLSDALEVISAQSRR
jgi:CBS domain-containing protein